MRNPIKYLFFLLSLILVFLFVVLLSQIWLFLILEIYESLPIILSLAVMFYIVTDVFTPNKKHSSLLGWIYAEYLEHIIFPIILVLTFLISPIIFTPLLFFLIFYFYGYILGKIKQFRDALSVLCLTLLFAFLLWFPDITLFINVYLNMGKYTIITFLLIFTVSYIIHNAIKSCKLPNESDNLFFKTYFLSIISGVTTTCILLI